jgi:protein-L-isoaspartate O-methyltransferase
MGSGGSNLRHRLIRATGNRLSKLGEKLGIAALTYNPLLFRHFHEVALASAPGTMRALAIRFPEAQRYADVGAGSGAYAAEAQRLGRQVVACEHHAPGRRLAIQQGVDCRAFDLSASPPAELNPPFDLVYCFEVAEHLPPDLGERLVEFLAAQGQLIVFSAAHPGQTGHGHINEQPKEYWIERFANRQMRYCPEESATLVQEFTRQPAVAHWLIQNAMVFRANSP